jgi:hypothetical protein
MNIRFFADDQWHNSGDTGGLMKPVFNIIKRVISFQVASITASNVAINFEPLALAGNKDNTTGTTGAEIANAEVKNLFEKFNMPNRRRDALFQAAIKGDVAAHYYWDPSKKPYLGKIGEGIEGEICFELVSGSNIFFGNANNHIVDIQPYILVSGRDMVDNLKEEAERYNKKNKVSNENGEIVADNDFTDETGEGGQIEVEADDYGKALYVIKYERDKKTGRIKASKSVKNAYIYKDVDTELSYYPIAWLAWEKQENQYHGRAACTGIIPNQIFINKMFAMVMYNLMMTAFPKGIYNADYISGMSNEIGVSIGVKGADTNTNIKNLAGYLESGNMSTEITGVIQMAMSMTKECLGVSDAALGNVTPTNTSAIIAVSKSTVIPLENIRANEYEWNEEQGKILLDMMGTYYGTRPIVISRDGKEVVEQYDFTQLKDLWLKTKVDVGEASYWSEIASLQTLDNLLDKQLIEFVDYLERLPDGYIPQRQELINKIKEKIKEEEDAALQQQNSQAEYEQMMQFFQTLPDDIKQKLQSLPDAQMEEQVREMMQQANQPLAS